MAYVTTSPGSRARWLAPVVFTATIFLSASLLFFVQPLFTRIVLPHIGGAPAVWTTAMLFFQTTLIAGYLYSHIIARRLTVGMQIVLHLTLWGAALMFLPLSVPQDWVYAADRSSVWQTLALFALGVGLPFAVLSANAPLIQSWYTRTGGPLSGDPYFLYGASNLGSLIALLGFPLVAEPLFGATQIGRGWMMGFWALGALLLMSGLIARRPAALAEDTPADNAPAPTFGRMAHWAALAFVPSSLMLAVTTKISTDIGALPLVWVLPLSLYLLTFVLIFTSRPVIPWNLVRIGLFVGLGILTAGFSGILGVHVSIPIAAVLILGFFLVGLFMHGQLYSLRPPATHLTTFYVTMSVGGALGGLFNSVLAPALFNDLYEGAATVAVAVALVVGARVRPDARSLQIGVIGAGAILAVLLVRPQLDAALGVGPVGWALMAAVIGIVLAFRARLQTVAVFAVATLGTSLVVTSNGELLFSDRSFFGTHKVLEKDGLRLYANGVTWHGSERLEDLTRARPAPQSYYHRNGPMAQIVTAHPDARSVGIVGLGVGALSCYARPDQDWHFYEIDRTVDRVARDPSLFTFMSRCGADMPTHMGDARMVLERQDLSFDILVIDAYSSDSVPVHLTTVEAAQIYLDRLAENGLLVFHISNRYYDIAKPIGRMAAALGLEARIQHYAGNQDVDPGDGASLVAVMARGKGALATLDSDPRWRPLSSDGGPLWTDDYANPLGILLR